MCFCTSLFRLNLAHLAEDATKKDASELRRTCRLNLAHLAEDATLFCIKILSFPIRLNLAHLAEDATKAEDRP